MVNKIDTNTENDDDDNHHDFEDAPEYPPPKSTAASLSTDILSLPKRLAARLDLTPAHNTHIDADDHTVPGITDTHAFNTALLFPPERSGVRGSLSKSVKGIQRAGFAVAHPKRAIKARAAREVPIDEAPYLNEEADRELLAAEEELRVVEDFEEEIEEGADDDSDGFGVDREEDGVSSGDEDDDTHENYAQMNGNGRRGVTSRKDELRRVRSRRVQELEDQRQAMRAAWITSKHVKRVRRIPHRYICFPSLDQYYQVSHTGGDGLQIQQKKIFRWDKYVGHMLLYITQDYASGYVDDAETETSFDRNVLLDHVQRLLIATAPWQAWMMSVRRVYRWEDPWVTGRWFVLYLVLLKTGYIMTFFYSYVIYITLRARFTSQTEKIQALRDVYTRAHDQHSRVAKLTELLQRHGSDQWLDPLLEELGPMIQRQICDAADFCEVMQNFYHWTYPSLTRASLAFWIMCACTTAFTSAEYSAKIFWFIVGFWFFWSRPLASRYPEYRKLVSLFRWLYWGIPTFAELAMNQLRVDAAAVQNRLVQENTPRHDVGSEPVSHSDPRTINSITKHNDTTSHQTSTIPPTPIPTPDSQEIQILSFRGIYKSTTGRLVVTTTGLHFLPSSMRNNTPPSSALAEKALWSRPFTHLYELRKLKTKRRVGAALPVPLPNSLLASTAKQGSSEGEPPSDANVQHNDHDDSQNKEKITNETSTSTSTLKSHAKKHLLSLSTLTATTKPSKSLNQALPKLGTWQALELVFLRGSSSSSSGDSRVPVIPVVKTGACNNSAEGSTSLDHKRGPQDESQTPKRNQDGTQKDEISDTETLLVEGLHKRDEAFNLILGASSLKFQVLQPGSK